MKVNRSLKNFGKSLHALPIVAITFAALSFASSCCKMDDRDFCVMLTYYDESTHLPTAITDSIHRFATKLETYILKNSEEKANPLYPAIKQNISQAAKLSGLNIVIKKTQLGTATPPYISSNNKLILSINHVTNSSFIP